MELRYKLLVIPATVKELDILKHKVIYTDKYTYVSVKEGFSSASAPAHIADVFNHRLSFDKEAEMFYVVRNTNHGDDIIEFLKGVINGNKNYKIVEVYQMNNHDGRYYAIDPRLTDNGNYEVKLYSITDMRKNSGMIITERFF